MSPLMKTVRTGPTVEMGTAERTARKLHHCGVCFEPILKGERYADTWIVDEHERYHIECVEENTPEKIEEEDESSIEMVELLGV